jgi:hypothetical protein
MLSLVRYFAGLGFSTALILLNTSVVSLLFGQATNTEHISSLPIDALYGAALLVAISALTFIL